MKRQIIALVLAVITLLAMIPTAAFPVNAQPQTAQEKRLTGVKSYDEDGTLESEYVYEYDGNGRLVRIRFTELDWTLLTELTYDSDGRLLSRITQDPQWPGESSGERYTYNAQGQLVECYQWEGSGVWEYYEYDAAGRLIRTKRVAGMSTTITDYTYGADGLLENAVIVSSEQGSGEPETSNQTYRHDQQGRVTEMLTRGEYSSTVCSYDYSFAPFTISHNLFIRDGSSSWYLTMESEYGQKLESIYFSDPQFYMDADGYLAKAVDTATYGTRPQTFYEFYYDGVRAEPLEDGQPEYTQTGWNRMYYDLIVADRRNVSYQNYSKIRYQLIWLDGDDIPELWIDYGVSSSGCRLVTVSGGALHSHLLQTGALTYWEAANEFYHSSGSRDDYSDTVYKLEGGELVTVAAGSYNVEEMTFLWDGAAVSGEVYFQKLNAHVYGEAAEHTNAAMRTEYQYSDMLETLFFLETEDLTAPAPDHVEPPAQSGSRYAEFILNREYLPYYRKTVVGYIYTDITGAEELQFALADLNADGVQEMIIDVPQSDGFHYNLFFTLDAGGDLCFCGDLYLYGLPLFSAEHQALAYVNMRPFYGYEHARLEGTVLTNEPMEHDDTFEQLQWLTKEALLDALEAGGPSQKPNAELKVYFSCPDLIVGTDQIALIVFELYIDGKHTPIESFICGGGQGVLELLESGGSDDNHMVVLRGLRPGYTEISVTEVSTGTMLSIPLTVVDKCDYYRCDLVTNGSSSGPIYVDGYSCVTNADGTHTIQFDAYNTSYAYGVVEVRNGNGELLRCCPVKPKADGSGTEKAVNSVRLIWRDIQDLFDGDTPFYKNEGRAAHTKVTLENIPVNAEIVITADGEESMFATLYTGVDIFVRTVFAAATFDVKIEGQYNSVRALMDAVVDSITKSVADDELRKQINLGILKESADMIGTTLAFMNGSDDVSDVYQYVSNLFQSLTIDAEEIIKNVLSGMGYSLVDAAFTVVVPPYIVVLLVDQFLELTWPAVDYFYNLDKGRMEIHGLSHNWDNIMVNNGVVMTQQGGFTGNTVLDADVLDPEDDLPEVLEQAVAGMTHCALYDITLRRDGKAIQPEEELEIRLPVPEGADGSNCVIYRIEEDGTKTLLPSTLEEDVLVFRTTHLSYYIVGEDAADVVAGDVNGDGTLNSDDAIHLLYHTLFGGLLYPIDQDCDFDDSGNVDSDDAIYLLYHTLFGDGLYPLN